MNCFIRFKISLGVELKLIKNSLSKQQSKSKQSYRLTKLYVGLLVVVLLGCTGTKHKNFPELSTRIGGYFRR